jgi:hypothetical protein
MIQCPVADVYREWSQGSGSRRWIVQTPVIEEIVEREAPQCRHHWVIETPHGATSIGRCKLCSEVREFRNSAADTLWEGDPMSTTVPSWLRLRRRCPKTNDRPTVSRGPHLGRGPLPL